MKEGKSIIERLIKCTLLAGSLLCLSETYKDRDDNKLDGAILLEGTR